MEIKEPARARGCPKKGQRVEVVNAYNTVTLRGVVVEYLATQVVVESLSGDRAIAGKDEWRLMAQSEA